MVCLYRLFALRNSEKKQMIKFVYNKIKVKQIWKKKRHKN